MSISVIPSGAPVGAEIRGVRIKDGIDDATFKEIRDAFHEHSVVVLRDQHLTPEEQIAFCGRFGKLEPHTAPIYLVPGYPDLLCISNVLDASGKPIGVIDAGRIWHSDGHYDDRPNMYSMLYAREVPHAPDGTPLGSTWFVSTIVAYDRLDAALKQRLAGLKAENSLASVRDALRRLNLAAKRAPLTDEWERKVVVHPVIRTHPVTGRRAVYVTAAATLRILGVPEEESRALIDELQGICTSEDMIYRHQWQVGDILMWDNAATQHYANGDYALPERRLMHRTTIEGAVPF